MVHTQKSSCAEPPTIDAPKNPDVVQIASFAAWISAFCDVPELTTAFVVFGPQISFVTVVGDAHVGLIRAEEPPTPWRDATRDHDMVCSPWESPTLTAAAVIFMVHVNIA